MPLDIGSLFAWWENIGVFEYLLPFLLIFAIVYGVLEASKILSGNKAINGIVAVVIGLLTLRVTYVQLFFTELFPRFGVALAVLLVLLILTGLFISKEYLKVMMWVYIAVGTVIGLVVIASSFGAFGFGANWYESELAMWIISAVLLGGLFIAIFVGKGGKDDSKVVERFIASR